MLTVKFASGEFLQGTAWNSLPNEPIISLKYKIGNKVIRLAGYESYNHLVEKVASMGFIPTITKIFLVGRSGDRSQIVTIDFKNETLDKHTTCIGNEYNGQVTTGWKPGVIGNEVPVCTIIEAEV